MVPYFFSSRFMRRAFSSVLRLLIRFVDILFIRVDLGVTELPACDWKLLLTGFSQNVSTVMP
jgi:hypothetical protein